MAFSEDFQQFVFNAWSLLLLWFIGGVYIPREYLSRKFERIKCWFGCERIPPKLIDTSRKGRQVAIVTGGSRGIGLALVKRILALNVQVIIGSSAPDEKRDRFQKLLESEFPDSNVSVWYLDLARMKTVEAFAERFWETRLPLHSLINNAGIMFEPKKITEDRFESHLAINYLGHCLLMRLLLPIMNKTGNDDKTEPQRCPRIINVTSCVSAVGTIRLEDFQSQKMYSPYQAYMQSKLAQLMFTYVLQSYLDSREYKVVAMSVHPGVVDTGLHQHIWWAPKSIRRLYKSPEEGAECILHATLSEDLNSLGGGLYLENCQPAKSCRLSYNKTLQDKLWLHTWRLLERWIPEKDSPKWA